MSIHNDIGDNIIEIRKSKNLTQEKLALESEISLSYLRLIEHGKANPTINELLKISNALNFDFKIRSLFIGHLQNFSAFPCPLLTLSFWATILFPSVPATITHWKEIFKLFVTDADKHFSGMILNFITSPIKNDGRYKRVYHHFPFLYFIERQYFIS